MISALDVSGWSTSRPDHIQPNDI